MESMYKDACFFRVLEEPVSSMLMFPNEFVGKYGEMLPEEAYLMTEDNYGRCWKVKVARLYSGRVCFAQGWPHFVDENPQIRASDFALFQLVDESTFHVSVFEKNGLKKPLSLSPLPHSPPPPQVVENNRRNNSSSSGRSRNNNNNNNNQRGEGVEVDGVKSFSIPSLTRNHFYLLNIPMRFAEECGIAYKSGVRLKNEDGVCWEVSVRVRESDGRIHLGGLDWEDFWVNNWLTFGNKLTFSIHVGDDPGTLHVSREGFIEPTPPKKKSGRPRKHL